MTQREELHEEFADRLIEQGLAEIAGDRRPPDLTARVLKAASARSRYGHPMRAAIRGGLLAATILLTVLAWRFHNTRGASERTGINESAADNHSLHQMIAEVAKGAVDGSAFGSHSLPQDLYSPPDQLSQSAPPASPPQDGTPYMFGSVPNGQSLAARRDARHKGVVDQMYRSELLRIPAPYEPPILYPDLETWRLLAERQERGGDHDRLPENPANAAPAAEDENHARYSRIIENPFLAAVDNPLSTFSIDVDTASYAKVRRYLLESGELPPPDAVRIEELVNYFDYDYAPPDGDAPFAAHVEVTACPWQLKHRLVRIGIKGREMPAEARPAANLVFLLDVSGSMEPEDKLPRVRRAMRMLVEQLRENDRVAIVVYAAQSGLVLPSTTGFEKDRTLAALDSLHAGGGTNGGDGIRLAYDIAQQNFQKDGVNRVILCTDGDFNVGTTSNAELERLIEERAKSGVFLTVLGFGMGNHNDELMEKLADKGNGDYGYVDSEAEARKLLVEQAGGTLVTIAKDVKLQLEFNPRLVCAYRLLGYEDRLLAAEDFNNDQKDAGEIGAGHTVTALYELIPAGQPVAVQPVDELKYQRPASLTEAAGADELLTLKLKYKRPDGNESLAPIVCTVRDAGQPFGGASADTQFAAAVAGFGLLLRDSQYKGDLTYDAVIEIAAQAVGPDAHGHRAEFLDLVRKARELAKKP